MSTEIGGELAGFHRFITERLDRGDLSPEQALEIWRAANPSQEEYAETVVALREAFAEMEAGDTGISLETFEREFRRKHGILPGP